MKKAVLFIYRTVQGDWVLMDGGPTLKPLTSAAVLGLGVAFTATYNTGILQVWYHLIDRHFNLLHVRFEDELSISLLKNRATWAQKLTTTSTL
jgi:hypothetical protein